MIQYITKKFERRFLINKTELVAAVAESTGVSKKETAAVIDATFEKIAAHRCAAVTMEMARNLK